MYEINVYLHLSLLKNYLDKILHKTPEYSLRIFFTLPKGRGGNPCPLKDKE